MKNRLFRFEFLISISIHLLVIFVFGRTLYQESAYSMASQAIEISMEMIPEVPQAQAMSEPVAEVKQLVKNEFIKPKEIVKKQEIPKKKPRLEKKQELPKQINTVQNQNIVSKTSSSPSNSRGRIGSGNGIIKYDTKAKPDYLRNPAPEYPWQSKRNREQGVVLLKVKILADGKVKDLSLKKSSRYPRLDNAALNSVKNWRFKPAKFAGISVESEVVVPIRFVLK